MAHAVRAFFAASATAVMFLCRRRHSFIGSVAVASNSLIASRSLFLSTGGIACRALPHKLSPQASSRRELCKRHNTPRCCRSSRLGCKDGYQSRAVARYVHSRTSDRPLRSSANTAHHIRRMTSSARIRCPGSTAHLASSLFGAVKKVIGRVGAANEAK